MPVALPVSVVVPTRDRPALVSAMVRSVLAGSAVPSEIIVADQSRPALQPLEQLAVPEGCRIVHLPLGSTGLSRARNVGLHAARHEIVVLSDDDVIVSPDWLERLVGALREAPERAVVTGLVLPERPIDRETLTPSVHNEEDRARRGTSVLRVIEGRVRADPLFPQNMALPREAFRDVGLFDERLGAGARFFRSAEDNDLGFRLLEAGYRVLVVGDAVVTHRSWRRRRDLVALGWAYGVGQGGFFGKHVRSQPRFFVGRYVGEVGWRARRSARVLLREPRQVLADLAYVTGLTVGLFAWLVRYGASDYEAPRLPTPPLADRG